MTRGPKQGKGGYVYIMGNKTQTVLYTGVTANIEGRVWEHKNDKGGAFTSQYECNRLLYFESYDSIRAAIDRESQIKNWNRGWKIALIEKNNPLFEDLAEAWFT
jgi:putative endonuclease